MKILCPNCGKNKYDPAKFEQCYNCSQEEDGKIICKECGEGWHDKQYEMCYECWNELSDEEDEPWDEDGDDDVSTIFPKR